MELRRLGAVPESSGRRQALRIRIRTGDRRVGALVGDLLRAPPQRAVGQAPLQRIVPPGLVLVVLLTELAFNRLRT